MKIRNGFVSNSSSSSFVIRNTNIYDIALVMLSDVHGFNMNYDSDIDNNDPMSDNNLVKIVKNIKRAKKANLNIQMPTVNYDTYLACDNSDVIGETCNNITWSNLGKQFDIDWNEDYPLSELEKYKALLFLYTSEGKIFTREKYSYNSECTNCSKGYGRYRVSRKGEIYCPNCKKSGVFFL